MKRKTLLLLTLAGLAIVLSVTFAVYGGKKTFSIERVGIPAKSSSQISSSQAQSSVKLKEAKDNFNKEAIQSNFYVEKMDNTVISHT